MKQLPPLDNDKEFEKLVRDICRNIYKEPSFELYGRRGEEQSGIDGYHLIDGQFIAFQCKKKDIINRQERKILYELKSEMSEDSEKAYQFFKDKLHIKKYIFATTYKNTKHLQDYANALSLKLGFRIEYWGWDTIVEYLQRYPELIKLYYPQFIQKNIERVEECAWYITKSEIQNSLIHDKNILLEKALDYYYYYVKYILTLNNTLVYPLGYETPRDRTIPVETGGLLG